MLFDLVDLEMLVDLVDLEMLVDLVDLDMLINIVDLDMVIDLDVCCDAFAMCFCKKKLQVFNTSTKVLANVALNMSTF